MKPTKEVPHSPTPWKVVDAAQGLDPVVYIYSEKTQKAIATLQASRFLPSEDGREANAAFIVRACNAHEALIKACHVARAEIEYLDLDRNKNAREAWNMIEAALKLSEEK